MTDLIPALTAMSFEVLGMKTAHVASSAVEMPKGVITLFCFADKANSKLKVFICCSFLVPVYFPHHRRPVLYSLRNIVGVHECAYIQAVRFDNVGQEAVHSNAFVTIATLVLILL